MPTRLQRAAPAGSGLKVHGQDRVDFQRGGEPLDLLGHVRRHEALVVARERVGAALELVVEAVAVVLAEDALLGPLAVGAAERDLQ